MKRRHPRASVTAVDLAAPMLQVARRRSRFWRPIRCLEADARALPFEDESFDLVFSNLMLQWLDPPDAALAEARRVLRPGGLLLLSSFGPETLQELRAAWQQADDGVHVNEFVDMHDLGSALQRAGFAEPVLDTDRYVRHYPDARALMRSAWLGEAGKLLLTALLFGVIFAWVRPLSVPGVFAGFIGAQGVLLGALLFSGGAGPTTKELNNG